MASKKRRILIVLSEFGLCGEDLIGPPETFDQTEYDVDFAPPVEGLDNGLKRPGW